MGMCKPMCKDYTSVCELVSVKMNIVHSLPPLCMCVRVCACVSQVICSQRLPQGKGEFSGLSHRHSEKIFQNKYACICHGNFLLHSGQQGFLEL